MFNQLGDQRESIICTTYEMALKRRSNCISGRGVITTYVFMEKGYVQTLSSADGMSETQSDIKYSHISLSATPRETIPLTHSMHVPNCAYAFCQISRAV